MQNRQKFVTQLFRKLKQQCPESVLLQMWNEGLLDKKAVEKLYIISEIERRVRNGEIKTKVMEHLSNELSCSYEKIRGIVYHKF
ncbi:MAG: hypothetical protein J6J57_05960 [Alistipes sp.]|nr:hypothetical protein [Alistipes sp.]